MTGRISSDWRAFALALLLLWIAACTSQASDQRGPVVLAASSMQEALELAASEWALQGHPEPVLAFAATSALARQAQQGAPADVFVSADEEWMDTLESEGLLRAGSRVDLVGNRLALIKPRGSAARGLADLGSGRLALADPLAVPAGRYARAALESRGAWNALRARVVPTENVRAALVLVERGEASLGIVYATDAQASDRVEVVELFPAGSHPPIRYPAAVLARSDNRDAAGFLGYLRSPQARAIFAAQGFEMLE